METTLTKKITRGTIKSFIKKNEGEIYIKNLNSFDGMVDCVMPVKDDFSLAVQRDMDNQYTMGVQGAWFVGSSRDYFNSYEDDEFTGFAVSNCCGNFIIAIKK